MHVQTRHNIYIQIQKLTKQTLMHMYDKSVGIWQ
jgi:hypothetical protein